MDPGRFSPLTLYSDWDCGSITLTRENGPKRIKPITLYRDPGCESLILQIRRWNARHFEHCIKT